MRFIVSCFMLVVFFFLASCQSAPQKTDLSSNVIRQYMASEIEVIKGNDFNIGTGVFLKDERHFLADQFIAALGDQLPGELKFSLLGEKPAKVSVQMSTVSIATASGRRLNGEASVVRGRVLITDLETGQIVGNSELQAVDAGAQNSTVINGVPVGAIASFVENSNSVGGTVVIKARDAFLRELRTWLR